MIRFADEKPKRKTPAPKPGRLNVSDGAKALAAFNRTAARRNRPAPQPTNRAAENDRAERTLAETASGEAVDESRKACACARVSRSRRLLPAELGRAGAADQYAESAALMTIGDFIDVAVVVIVLGCVAFSIVEQP